MHFSRVILFVSLAVFASSTPTEIKDAQSIEKIMSPPNYKLTPPMSVFEAIIECQKYDGRLVAIEDPLKENALIVFLRTYNIKYAWTSGIEKGTEFIWATTNAKVHYENWGQNWPNPGEGCIVITEDASGDYHWEQDHCGSNKFGICEIF